MSETKSVKEVRVAMFSTKSYDRSHFDPHQSSGEDVKMVYDYFEFPLSLKTAALAVNHEVVCCFVNDDLSAPVLEQLTNVKLIAMRCAGFNNVDLKKASELGKKVVRVPTYSPHAVAEHAVGLALALDRKIHLAYNKVREGNFQLEGLLGFDLFKKRVGVIGTGAIGTVFARIMKCGFECDVVAYDVYQSQECIKLGIPYVALDELLSTCDIISLHVPLLPSTKYLINKQSLEKMKKGAMLINTSRGGLINTADAVSALKSGQLGSLGLDVYEGEAALFFEDHTNEVIQDDIISRLMTFKNVLITGHQAFFTKEALTEISKTTNDNIQAFFHEQPLKNEVLPPK